MLFTVLKSHTFHKAKRSETTKMQCVLSFGQLLFFFLYFHNEVYYFNRRILLRVDFSILRQEALFLSCYCLGQGVQIDFSFIQQDYINLLFIHYSSLLHCKLHEVKDHIECEHH